MQYDQHLVAKPWSDYELLDSGENMKLERFGDVVVARPETQALWSTRRPELWQTAHAVFASGDKRGAWQTTAPVPETWPLGWRDVRFTARLTGFKHTGIFPEQEPNWEWLSARLGHARKQPGRPEGGDPRTFSQHAPGANVLNLFGYTGIASLVAAQAGAFVTHVDASKQSLDWAHDNARLSQIPEDRIRWILDDALAFVKREVRRGAIYDGIILDPPAFGRGAKGEAWKIEESLAALLRELAKILAPMSGSFMLLNGYAAGYAARSFAQAVESAFPSVEGECGELLIRESGSSRTLPAGIYVRFVR
ncbi:SAM-dependent methyltransferase [Candidatus Kaiserbacteria bacterium CG10_big_fil_rev_8_21_14_0_10_56_12]|uniref:SAM-dependent methyltransferase n=1 Tax=Candidatus Kaiserbacteria bacterium CG10_big_fil_rev_8_21_14_0_10_56_12 TaxID=1974611 RepID=A0A2H0UA29_9BACT|nr:MAG: SAM-dependent methyltransferase [Candidatus Kaiserbacteria bacterium CG10_big_fil_rev_8_21_14_0_10_56_12]